MISFEIFGLLGIFSLLLPIVWFIREIKAISFWLYLWQLKEYRAERFLDHFRTDQGKRIFLNKLFIGKLSLFVFAAIFLSLNPEPDTRLFDLLVVNELSFIIAMVLGMILFLVYVLESAKMMRDRSRNKVLGPMPTKKIVVLRSVLLAITLLFIALPTVAAVTDWLFWIWKFYPNLYVGMLGYDLLTPMIVSVVVLGLQPFTVFARKRTLAKAKAKRATFKNLKVIGITGSYGKTSTKEFLAHILSAKFVVLKTPEHQNSEFGVANTILRSLTDEHEIFVCEMGAYKKGEIKALADVAKPDIGIITGVNEQHLATFGSMENLLSAEGGEELIRALPKDSVTIINGGSEKLKNYLKELKKANKSTRFVVTGEDIQAKNVKIEKKKISFEAEGAKFEVPAYGGHNVENLLLAIAAAKSIGMNPEEIAKAARTMPLELSALKVSKGLGGAAFPKILYVGRIFQLKTTGCNNCCKTQELPGYPAFS